MSLKISVDTDVCIGAGQCALAAPAVFDQRVEDGIVELLDAEPPADQRAAVEEATVLCPAGAVSLS
ncbi:ferredoxin [Streptomyces sp. NPDC006356]